MRAVRPRRPLLLSTRSPSSLTSIEDVSRAIVVLRGRKVLLDAELAALYGVTTKRLNEQVRRNRDRFPTDFMFELTAQEAAVLRSQFATLKSGRGQHRKYLPYAFTEHGAIMAASVLKVSRRESLGLPRPTGQAARHLRQRQVVRQHRAALDRNGAEAGLFILPVPAVHGEVRAGNAERRPRDGVGEPVRIVLEALVAGGGAQAITQQAPHPPIVITP